MTMSTYIPNDNLMKVIFAGNIDDGKSSIIGRLFYDSNNFYEDQLQDLKRASELYGRKHLDLSLFTDGLRSEREQGITIDVAHLYFKTSKRRFVILDTPGHEQYMANMISAASQANIAVILIDIAQQFISESTKRHLFICSEMGIQHIILAFNKMDLVDYSQESFIKKKGELENFLLPFTFNTIKSIPISALFGDMVVQRKNNLSWYTGETLLECLETMKISKDTEEQTFVFSIQGINRPHALELPNFRGYNGQILSGQISENEEVIVYPQKRIAKIKAIYKGNQKFSTARNPLSVTLLLDREFDVNRGNVIATEKHLPKINHTFNSRLFWFSTESHQSREYIIKFLNNHSKIETLECYGEIDLEAYNRLIPQKKLQALRFHDVKLSLQDPVVYYDFKDIPSMGQFILIDQNTLQTVAAGIIQT